MSLNSNRQFQPAKLRDLFRRYQIGEHFDEMFEAPERLRPHYRQLYEQLQALSVGELAQYQELAARAFLDQGITFTVYGDAQETERIFPFDLLPRIIPNSEWRHIEQGIRQRIQALNAFLFDVYGEQRILREGIIPRELVEGASGFQQEFVGFRPPRDLYIHIAGIDLVRNQDGTYLVLEDNLRTPSGISYVLETREIMKRVFPSLFKQMRIRPVDHYPNQLLENLRYLAPDIRENPTVVLLTPGVNNSAYFEHSFLALQMGIELVEGRDLIVESDRVYMKTTQGLQQVDVIYRRVDDRFLDPEVFHRDSLLGVPGLMRAYHAGHVALANAIGNGVADDKAIYAYVPQMIAFYLSETPVLPNVDTYLCSREGDLRYVLDHLPSLVVKAVNESGGYGMLMGPASTKAEQEEFRTRIRHNPRNYIAQPIVSLSRLPCLTDNHSGDFEFAGRHIDLRPFVLSGKDITLSLGGLTRVALQEGSLVVNSSQGGGSKGTWVLYGED
ncbi:MAG: circularly permuted type 2 ATP-grasp protein [Nitrospira sp.]|nr:circularly permuted type 2 ATP-grasp protein [Nitrospira sp.]